MRNMITAFDRAWREDRGMALENAAPYALEVALRPSLTGPLEEQDEIPTSSRFIRIAMSSALRARGLIINGWPSPDSGRR